MATRTELRVLSWNLRGISGIPEPRMRRLIEAIASDSSDIILLQEVTAAEGVAERLREHFARRLRCDGWLFSGENARDKLYGNVIASRFPLEPNPRRPKPDAPWPQLLARATIDSSIGQIDAISVHMPNGSGNGWTKVETFEALGSIMADEHRGPLVVGGDFNEPRHVDPDNGIESFGADEDGTVRGHWRDPQGRRYPTARWQAAVEGVLGPRSILQQTWLAKNPGVNGTTHVVRGKERFFDHILVSRDRFEVVAAGFHHSWRTEPGLSDHSATWAVIRKR